MDDQRRAFGERRTMGFFTGAANIGNRIYRPESNGPFPAEVARDAYDGLSHLSKQAFIDRDRIYQAGYSLGALASALLASPESAGVLKTAGKDISWHIYPNTTHGWDKAETTATYTETARVLPWPTDTMQR